MYYGEDNTQDYGLVNQLMINQFAEQLIETNVIDLSHVSFDENEKKPLPELKEVDINPYGSITQKEKPC